MPTSCQLQLPVRVERGSQGDGSNQSPAERDPSLSSCPTGRLLELNPAPTSASAFPTTQTHSSQWGKTLQTPRFLCNGGALTQWHKIQDLNACLISISVCAGIFLLIALSTRWGQMRCAAMNALKITEEKKCYTVKNVPIQLKQCNSHSLRKYG